MERSTVRAGTTFVKPRLHLVRKTKWLPIVERRVDHFYSYAKIAQRLRSRHGNETPMAAHVDEIFGLHGSMFMARRVVRSFFASGNTAVRIASRSCFGCDAL